MNAILRPWPNQLRTAGQVKPQGVPRIDWTHPLANGLISYWFDTGLGFYLDLVTGDVSVKGGTGAFPSPTSSPYGTGFSYTQTAAQGQQGSQNFVRQSWAAPYSFAAGWYQIGTPVISGGPTTFCLADASGNSPLEFFFTGTSLFAFFANQAGNGISLGSFPAAGSFNVAVGVASGATAQTAYLNGINKGTEAVSSTYSGTNLKICFDQFRTNSVSNETINGITFFGAIWNRALTATEASQLYTDPYSFLIPTEPEMMAVKSGQILSLPAGQGTFSVTGIAATLTSARSIAAVKGTFTLTGRAATPNAGRSISAAKGTFTMSGIAATMNRGIQIQAVKGSFVVTSIAVSFPRAISIPAAQGTFVLSGKVATLPIGRSMNAGQGSFVVSGKAASFPIALSLKATLGTYALTGMGATLTFTPASGGATVSHSNPFFSTPGPMTSLP